MLEVEVKFREDLGKAEQLLKARDFVLQDMVYERDVYYNSPVKDLKKEDKALRIREHRVMPEGQSVFTMNYKGPKLDEATMTRQETEFEIPSFEQGDQLFKGLGFAAAGIVEKVRTSYVKGDITCCLDQVTGLGAFMEIEILTDEAGYEAALNRIQALLACFGAQLSDTIRRSYLSMLMEK